MSTSLASVSLVRGAGLFAAIGLVAMPVMAAPLDAGIQWSEPSSVKLDVDFPGDGYHASWQLFRCDCGDLLIRSELSLPGEVAQGDILLVANRAVLMRGYGPDDADQISLDAPALMMQLATRLLQRALPSGPAAVIERQKVAVEDSINPINLDTGVAVGGFPAPWSLKGWIWPQQDSQRRFDLEFTFTAAGVATGEPQQARMKLAGVAEYAAAEFPLAADMELEDWALSWRDENDAAATAVKVQTLAQLRQQLSGTLEESPR